MRKIAIILLLSTVILSSCSENDKDLIADAKQDLENTCAATNPLEVKWMQDLITDLNCGEYACKVAILKSEYQGKIVFFSLINDPLCNAIGARELYNCDGDIIKKLTPEESIEFLNNPNHKVEEIFSCNE